MAKILLAVAFIGTVGVQLSSQDNGLLTALRNDPYAGAYCSRRPLDNQCCTSRNDDCSMPIAGTKCYCDQFCNQHGPSRDCCPDYESFCLRVPNRTCFYDNKYHPIGYTFRRSHCEECTCSARPGGTELICKNICQPTPGPDFLTACYWRNRYITVGQRIMEDECTECICMKCNNNVAEVQCVNRCDTPRPNPYTVGCDYNGHTYPEGHQMQQGCLKCTCKNYGGHGRMECINECPSPSPITNIVDLINRGNYGWRAYYYSFLSGKSLEEVYRQRTGVCLPSTTALHTSYDVQPILRLDDEFDARSKWPGWIQGIHDQMDYPQSWAFSTAEVISDRMAVLTAGDDRHSLSPWNLAACVKHKSSCKSTSEAWRHVHHYGITTEQCYPYVSDVSGCKVAMGPTTYTTQCPTGSREGYLYRMPQQYKVESREMYIQTEIQLNGPVQAHLRIKPDFFYYRSGVYRHMDSSSQKNYDASNHYLAVRIIGWGVDRTHGTETKYWLCTNSWGNQWGENGYFRILRGENEAEIEDHVIGVWSKNQHESIAQPRYEP